MLMQKKNPAYYINETLNAWGKQLKVISNAFFLNIDKSKLKQNCSCLRHRRRLYVALFLVHVYSKCTLI